MWNLFLDDERYPFWVYDKPSDPGGYTILRSTEAAQMAVRAFGMPRFMSLDHDLGLLPSGEDDTAIKFLRWLSEEVWDGKAETIPSYKIHSANPIGQENIRSFMESWRRSVDL